MACGLVVATVAVAPTATAALTVPAGVAVEGLVTDPAGAPVAGAAIWLSEPRDHAEGAFRARTDARGRFRLRSVAPSCWIGARAAGFAPTPVRVVAGKAGRTAALRLRLPGPGGALRGVVVDPTGAPVAGAALLVGAPAEVALDRSGDLPTMRPPGVPATTDARGGFVVDGLDPGPLSVLVRSPAFAPFATTATIAAGAVTAVRAVLAPGATLVGVVRDAGLPVAGARVGLGRDVGFYAFTWSPETFSSSFTFAAADGSFRLVGLPAGRALAWARTAQGDRVEREVVLTAGCATHWDPWLGVQAITGQVLDDGGRPLAGWFVQAWSGAAPCSRELPTTAADGSFVLPHAPGEVERIDVREPDSMRVCASAEVTAATAAVAIRVARRDLPSAFLTGVVCDAAGAAVSGALVRAWRRDETGEPRVEVDPATRAFRVGPLPPGSYAVAVAAPGFSDQRLAAPGLGPGETRDVGTVVLTPD